MKSRRFKGSKDPNTIVLEDLFPLIDIKLSTELKDDTRSVQDAFQEFVFEGEESSLRFIENNSEYLQQLGWRLGDPLSKGDRELRVFKRPRGDLRDHIEIPVFRGWHDLSEHFILSDRVKLIVRKESVSILEMTCDLMTDGTKHELIRIGGEKIAVPADHHKFN